MALKLLFRLLCVQPKKSDVQNDFNFVFAQHEVTFRIHTVHGISEAGNRKHGDIPDKSTIFLVLLLQAMFKKILLGPKANKV